MSEERPQPPKDGEATRALSPAAIALTLGAATVAWMIVKFIGQLGWNP